MIRKLIFILLLLPCFLQAQNIKTIQLRPHGENNFSAIVPLGTVLNLSFDDLDADSKTYQYKVELMNFDWKPTNLALSQYINGFEQNEILEYENSFNTLQSYTHYSVDIPNENTRITQSGNYLISVLNEDDEIVFSRRAIFYEDKTTVGVAVYRSRNTQTLNKQQTVQFTVNHPNLNINNPNQEIKVTLLQNDNWNTTITNLEPNFFKPNQLVYNYTLKTNFWGGNEFLHFDNKAIQNTSVTVAKTERKDVFHNYLHLQEERANKPYTYNPDINGQFVVRTINNSNSKIEADYAKVHFYLEAFEPYQNKEVYIYGAFNNFKLLPENKMKYNKKAGLYESTILLKQGFYNYSFATKNDYGKIDLTEVDGSFFETENNYTVIVYYKPFGGLFYKAIGVGNDAFNQNR